ncbi:DNA methyltransferase [Acidovorax sp. HDW3]|uniref:class I SAM-dependent DNA methyltransferase n=1 Tax=Acidovorax sp. HDW3 TaxID=2714923 RepID=UPI00197A8028
MFAEDVGLLPENSFQSLLQKHREQPAVLQQMLRILWQDMDQGGFSAALAQDVLHFNGKLFKGAGAPHYSLLLTTAQIDLLIAAARANWREVEPAIFGTLLERALDPTERHALGAHYTPRAYVERLVLPTVIAPLRAEWDNARAAALVLAREAGALEGRAQAAKLEQARGEIQKFHHRLCTLRVLDPACGSANFLYVTLEHLKRLEGEVINQLEALGQQQDQLGFEGETVTLAQLRGIELNERAAALAELVLWIGYLQWHIRSRGRASVATPVVHNYGNIECRDAVLAWDAQEPAYDNAGQLRTRWDGKTYKTHPATGERVPDEAAQVPQWRYIGARQAQWPQADFIVGNPPFIGKLRMREALGDGYVEALRSAWQGVPDSADFVMFWWHHAAQLVASGQVQRMGLITTNSLTMIFNRRVVQAALQQGTHLSMAIADHPWVDSSDGAAVRIAMTVLAPGSGEGELLAVTSEEAGAYGEMAVEMQGQRGLIHADLKIGANVTMAQALQANARLSSAGVIPHGAGMLLTSDEAAAMEPDAPIKPYRNGKDLTDKSRNMLVIDCYGLSVEQVRDRYPRLYQWLLDRVKPERDVNNDKDLREKWWLHRRNNEEMRRALSGLPRYIATVMTAKHRVFQFLDGAILPDQMLVVIGMDDAYTLGVLSSQLHTAWALATGGTLEDRPRYNKSRCFETFPFPAEATGLTPALQARIADLAEKIDAHRKRVLGVPPSPPTPLPQGERGATATPISLPALAIAPTPLPQGERGATATPTSPPALAIAPTPLPQGERGATATPTSPPALAIAPTPLPQGERGATATPTSLPALAIAPTPLPQGERGAIATPTSLPALAIAPTPSPLAGEGRGEGASATAQSLTLTGLYNVLAALREGRALTAKEKTLHTQGLVSVLRELHDELDAAVLTAYGLPSSASADAILQHLVQLNADRAREEAQGRIHWLRPAFQNLEKSLSKQELVALDYQAPEADLTPEKPLSKQEQTTWPATLPEQVRAVATLLAAHSTALPLPAIEAAFKGRGPWKKSLPTLLQTLEALGRARQEAGGWRAG